MKALCEVTEPMGDRTHLYLSNVPHSFVADVFTQNEHTFVLFHFFPDALANRFNVSG